MPKAISRPVRLRRRQQWAAIKQQQIREPTEYREFITAENERFFVGENQLLVR